MNRYNDAPKPNNTLSTGYVAFLLAIMAMAASSVLLGCAPQPKSMFEQQAEAEAANEISATSQIQNPQSSDPSLSTLIDDTKQGLAIDISKQQAIARQPNCIPEQNSCQYLELNSLVFTPAQPWLASIMWQTIARVLSPDTPLTSQQQVAKDSILALLKQIEFSTEGVSSQPSYQRIDTDLIVNEQAIVTDDTVVADADADNVQVTSGYLIIESTQHRGATHQQWHLDYVMLDMQKKLQLTIADILLPEVDTDQLLSAFQSSKNEWLISQGVERQYVEQWPLPLAEQWYIDQQGLHMVYQSGALLNNELDAVDLVVPFAQLQGLIKPEYKVRSSVSMTAS